MPIRNPLLLAALLAASAPVLACGPDFPPELLADRKATLLNLPDGAFARDAAGLLPKPPGNLPVVEHADWIWSTQAPSRDEVERGWLGDAYAQVQAMRAQADGKAAYAQGEGLAPEARLYTAGAVAYANGDPATASAYFRDVLALAPAQRPHYGVLAQYMLGQLAAQDTEAARHAYAALRDMVAAGAADPLGLAVTSFGEEARLLLALRDDAGAVALYAQQAATGSQFGYASLLQVARQLARDPARLDAAVADPLTQRLLAVYLTDRAFELDPSDEGGDDSAEPSAASAAPSRKAVDRFLAAAERRGLDRLEGADQLAALAYSHGDYARAERFAAKSEAGLAQWVRAKLALRAGDLARAAEAYAAASKTFPKGQESGQRLDGGAFDPPPDCRLEAERGVLALARSEYVAALEHLYAAKAYWTDAAYVAERVLTLDELKAFVDAKVPAAPPPKADAPWTGDGPALRALLARRLLRAERYDEALAYFDEAELKKKAEAYVAARRAAETKDRIASARGWYQAAAAARQDGLELLGFEGDPDYADWGGSYDLGSYDTVKDAQGFEVNTDRHHDLVVPADYAGKEEASRVAASRAQPLQRFHYRYVAARFAEKAADLVPARSQAFAAILCQATGWVILRDPAEGRRLYARYVKQGPYVAWAAHFGNDCPAPDFDGAAARLHREQMRAYKRMARHAAPYVAVGSILAGLAAFGVWLRRRRARA